MKAKALLFLIPVLLLTACETYEERPYHSRRYSVRGDYYDDGRYYRNTRYSRGPYRDYGYGRSYRSTRYGHGYGYGYPTHRRGYVSRGGYYHRPAGRVHVGVGF